MAPTNWSDRGFDPTNSIVTTRADAISMSQFFTQIYTWMALGLALTGFVAAYTTTSPTLMNLVFGSRFGFLGIVLVELVLVMAFTASLARGVALPAAFAMFFAYSALNGLTLSSVLLVYTGTSVATTFFVSAGTFAGMSLYGLITRKDMTGIGQFVRMGLWGVLLAMLVNFWLKSSALETAISLIGVGIFVVLTAYDTQRLKVLYHSAAVNDDGIKRLALQGALTLYLDFINLFLFLLRFMGRRRD